MSLVALVETALPMARMGNDVTGIDIASDLIEDGRERRAQAGRTASPIAIEGDAEELPYDDASFDIVFSLIGAMLLHAGEGRRWTSARLPSWRAYHHGELDAVRFRRSDVQDYGQACASSQGIPSAVLWGDAAVVTTAGSVRLKCLWHGSSALSDILSTRKSWNFSVVWSGQDPRFIAPVPGRPTTLHHDLEQLWLTVQSGDRRHCLPRS